MNTAVIGRFPGWNVLFLTLLLALLPRISQARQVLHVGDLGLDLSDDLIVVSATASVADEPQLRAMLRDGASVELTAVFRLERVRSFWSNTMLTEVEYVSALRLNPLTREFLYYPPGQEEAIADRSLSRLLAATWGNMRFPVSALSLLPEEDAPNDYRVEASFTLRHAEAPPWLPKAAFSFWSREIAGPVEYRLPFSR